MSRTVGTPSSLRGSLPSLALGFVLSAGLPTHALEGRIGTYVAEGPGVWLQVRHPIAGTDLGIHLAGSAIELEVGRASGKDTVIGMFGYPELATVYSPAQVTAAFYEWGVVAARKVHMADRWGLGISTGFLGGLLDGTQDERVLGPASLMFLVPVFLEVDWHPWVDRKRLGATFGLGAVWASPSDQDELYPEISPWRWQARAGILF